MSLSNIAEIVWMDEVIDLDTAILFAIETKHGAGTRNDTGSLRYLLVLPSVMKSTHNFALFDAHNLFCEVS